MSTGLSYEIGYKDSTAVNEVFAFDNMAADDSDEYFGTSILNYALEKCDNYLNKSIVKKYFPIKNDGNSDLLVSAGSKISKPTVYTLDYATCADDSTGIKLSSITPKELLTKWKCTPVLAVHTSSTGATKLAEIFKTTKLLIVDYCDTLNLNSIVCTIYGEDNDYSYQILYTKPNNKFAIKTLTQVFHDANYPDGHAIITRDITINNIKMKTFIGQKYDIKSKQYYFDAAASKYILQNLGYIVTSEEKHYFKGGKYTSHRWKVKGDEYEWTVDEHRQNGFICKNGTKIPLYYNLNETGISSDDFKKITSAVITIDDTNESILINGNKL